LNADSAWRWHSRILLRQDAGKGTGMLEVHVPVRVRRVKSSRPHHPGTGPHVVTEGIVADVRLSLNAPKLALRV